jgi:HEAT repeat protein
LGRAGDRGAAADLAEAMSLPGQPLLVRRALAAALAQIADQAAQPSLLAALADPDPQVRGYAASALGQIGDESARAPLQEIAADPSRLLQGTVGDAARRAMALLERRARQARPVRQPQASA